jgi:hypothetical protein
MLAAAQDPESPDRALARRCHRSHQQSDSQDGQLCPARQVQGRFEQGSGNQVLGGLMQSEAQEPAALARRYWGPSLLASVGVAPASLPVWPSSMPLRNSWEAEPSDRASFGS